MPNTKSHRNTASETSCQIQRGSGEEFLDESAVVDEVNWTAGRGVEHAVGVNSHFGVKRGGEVFGFVDVFGSVVALGVRGADDRTAGNARARHEHGHRPGPMIATRVFVDLRRAAKFTQANH